MNQDIWTDQDFANRQDLGQDPMIQGELAPGEKVVLAGRPRIGRAVFQALPFVFLGIPFTVVPLLALGMLSARESLEVFVVLLLGLPFLLVGLLLLSSPIWAARNTSRTRYAITDRRVILCEAQIFSGLEIRSYPPDALRFIVRNQRGDGSGDLIFEEIRTRNNDGNRRVIRRGFMAIDDVRGVENLLRATLLNDWVAQ